MKSIKIDIAGRGNVATHLQRMIELANRQASKADMDSPHGWKIDAKELNPHDLSGLRDDCDILLISVTDTAIPAVVASIPKDFRGIVAHTSGTTDISVFDGTGFDSAVFYPLQTFSKDVALRYEGIPIYVEARREESRNLLLELGKRLSGKVVIADSAQRRALHVASVFGCNFVNRMWAIADEIMTKAGMKFSDLYPLLDETLRKAKEIGPTNGQTGPAIRNDVATISRHLEFLKDDLQLSELYSVITENIKSTRENSEKS